MPSPSRSNPCGSGGTTWKSLSAISSQFKSGGGGAIQTSGYEASQFELDEAFNFVIFDPSVIITIKLLPMRLQSRLLSG